MTTPVPQTIARSQPSPAAKLGRLALVCDFLEEGWYSMDLFGDMLNRCLQSDFAGEVEVQQLRPALRPRLSALPLAGKSRVLWNADRLINRFQLYPRWLRNQAGKFDLYHVVDHSYSQLLLELPGERAVVTCHDVDTFRSVLEPQTEPRPAWYRAMTRRTLAGFIRAAHVICVSAATKADLLRHQLFGEDRLTVIPPGVDPAFFAAPDPVLDSRTSQRYPHPYVLHVGSTIPRKRIDVLLRVFARVSSEFTELRLVRAGGDLTAGQSELAASLGIADRVVQAPPLSKPELAALYRGAAIVLQTSSAEGFGLPVIEAMACGCPVIASDIPPLREAGGLAAEYCPVGNVEAIAAALACRLTDRARDLPGWEERRAQVRRHASDFTWSRNAKQTMDVYRQVALTCI